MDGVFGLTEDIRVSHVFFDALVRNFGATVHANFVKVDDWHHAAEALFKALGVCYRLAFGCDAVANISTKGEPRVL